MQVFVVPWCLALALCSPSSQSQGCWAGGPRLLLGELDKYVPKAGCVGKVPGPRSMLCLCRPNNAMLHGLPNVTALLGGVEPGPGETWLMGSTGLCTVGEPGGWHSAPGGPGGGCGHPDFGLTLASFLPSQEGLNAS